MKSIKRWFTDPIHKNLKLVEKSNGIQVSYDIKNRDFKYTRLEKYPKNGVRVSGQLRH